VSPPRGRLANHLGPGPCVTTREGEGEASAGECIGQPLSRERSCVLGADAFQIAEGNTDGSVIASTSTAQRGRRPWHVRTLLAREAGGLGFGLQTDTAGPRREGEEP
jgi:hypothetical protein